MVNNRSRKSQQQWPTIADTESVYNRILIDNIVGAVIYTCRYLYSNEHILITRIFHFISSFVSTDYFWSIATIGTGSFGFKSKQTETSLFVLQKAGSGFASSFYCFQTKQCHRTLYLQVLKIVRFLYGILAIASSWGLLDTVRYRHGGGWSRKINAWHLYTLMVYL
jgi:hypothetical protein